MLILVYLHGMAADLPDLPLTVSIYKRDIPVPEAATKTPTPIIPARLIRFISGLSSYLLFPSIMEDADRKSKHTARIP